MRRPLLLLPLLLASPAGAWDPALLAPSGPELHAALRTQTEREQGVRALVEATARLHNAWALAGWMEGREPLCEDPYAASLGARSRLFGAALRDQAQALRVHQDRVEHMARAPSAAPLLGAEGTTRLDALRADTEHHAAVYRELVAWQARFVEPRLKGCTPGLAEASGVPGLLPVEGPVAIAGVGGGRLCPIDAPAEGAAALAPQGRACYSPSSSCDCVPGVVEPGAVLGPGQPLSPPLAEPTLALPEPPPEEDPEVRKPPPADAETPLPGLYPTPAQPAPLANPPP